MASMYRNTNLEEIEVDSFLHIDFLKYQTLLQKIIFIGGIIGAGAVLIISTVVFHLNTFVSIIISFPFLILSIAFGCNYNQDLSLIKYLFLLLRDPAVKLESRPTEDLDYISEKAKDFSDVKESASDEQTAEAQKKLLKRFVFIIVGFVLFLVIAFVVLLIFKDNDAVIHHSI